MRSHLFPIELYGRRCRAHRAGSAPIRRRPSPALRQSNCVEQKKSRAGPCSKIDCFMSLVSSAVINRGEAGAVTALLQSPPKTWTAATSSASAVTAARLPEAAPITPNLDRRACHQEVARNGTGATDNEATRPLDFNCDFGVRGCGRTDLRPRRNALSGAGDRMRMLV
jgi:hypothetical protein